MNKYPVIIIPIPTIPAKIKINFGFITFLKIKSSLPTETAVKNLVYLKIRDIGKRYELQKLNGFAAYQVDLAILWQKYYPQSEERFTQ